MKLVYCDFIASKLREALLIESERKKTPDEVGLSDISCAMWDMSPEGIFISNKKVFHVAGKDGSRWKVTVEELGL